MKILKKSLLPAIIILGTICTISAQDIKINIGVRNSIQSEILNETRSYIIHLPENYSSEKTYPFLYRLDGDAEQLAETSVTTNRLTYGDEISPEIIIVAIENTNRPRDMWPTNSTFYPEPYVAGAQKFMEFIESELIPHIEKKYHPGKRILCGQSLSGVFALYTFISNPQLFDSYLVISGAFPGCNDYFTQLYNDSFNQPGRYAKRSIVITNGLQDPLDPDGSFEQQIAVFSDLIHTKLKDQVRHQYMIYENEGHVPYHSLYDGLKFIFASE